MIHDAVGHTYEGQLLELVHSETDNLGEEHRVLCGNVDESKPPQLTLMHVVGQKLSRVWDCIQGPVRLQISRSKLAGHSEYCRKNSVVGPELFGITIDADILYVGTGSKECFKLLMSEDRSVENDSFPVPGGG